MEDLNSLLNPILVTGNSELIQDYLLSCSELQAFTKGHGGVPLAVNIINRQLNEPASRYNGLLVLQSLLPQCSNGVLLEHGALWLTFCLKGIDTPRTSSLSYNVLKLLFRASSHIPELGKTVMAVVIPKFAEQIKRGVQSQSILNALQCLEVGMDKFNGSCGPHKKVFEQFIFSLVDYHGVKSTTVLLQAGRCVGLLPQLGGGGVGGTMYKVAWSTLQNSICHTLQLILDDLFSDLHELQVSLPSKYFGVEPLPLPTLDATDIIHRAQLISARVHSVSLYLQGLLLMHFPVPKSIDVPRILAVICRGLAVTTASVGNNVTTHSLALTSAIPKVHLSLLKLLETLMKVCRSNLLPFGGMICKLALQTLKWTEVNCTYGTEKPYSSLRTEAYNIITNWCGIAKSGSLVEDVSDLLIKFAVSDFYSEKEAVSLSAALSKRNKYASRRLPKKGSKEAAGGSLGVASNDLQPNSSANSVMCVAALRALSAMLAAASTVIKPTSHKTLQEATVSALIDVTNGNIQPLVPFSVTEPRLELYRLLLALVLDSHPVWPPPCNLAQKLFAAGLNDRDAQISTFCVFAQSCVEKIVHPAFSSMHFQVPISDAVNAVSESGKENSLMHGPSTSHLNGEDISDKENSDSLQNEVSKSSVQQVAVDVLNTTPQPTDTLPTCREMSQSDPPLESVSEDNCLAHMVNGDGHSNLSDVMTSHVKSTVKAFEKSLVENPVHRENTEKNTDPKKVSMSIDVIDLNVIDVESNVTDSTKSLTEMKPVLTPDCEEEEMIDLSGIVSDQNETDDGDIEEIPCEIDIADSEDEDTGTSSDIGLSNTSSSLLAHTGWESSPTKKLDSAATSPRAVPEIFLTPAVEGDQEAILCDTSAVSSEGNETLAMSSKGNGECLPETEKSVAPTSPPITRVLRSRTVSTSSTASTPPRKSTRPPSVLGMLTESEMLPTIKESSEPALKKLKLDEETNDNNLDEEAMMLSSFVDVTRGEAESF